jgi:hypothetical protein
MKLCQLRRPYITELQDDYERWWEQKAEMACEISGSHGGEYEA